MKKVLIAVPCMDMVSAPFAQSLATMNKNGGECYVSFIIGSLIYDSRNTLVKQAMQLGADYIMWFDSDMTFPVDTLDKMLKHMEDGKDVVSGLYFRRQPHYNPVLFNELEEDNGKCKFTNYDDYPKDSVFKIGGCGFGCVMTRTSIFEDIALQEGNWFEPLCNAGEDIAFCLRAKRCGYEIYCDSTIKCGHCGHITVTEKMFEAVKCSDGEGQNS